MILAFPAAVVYEVLKFLDLLSLVDYLPLLFGIAAVQKNIDLGDDIHIDLIGIRFLLAILA